jgi:hypothetical protein
MQRAMAIGLALVLLVAVPSRAEEHLVSRSTMQARLVQVAAQRQVDLTSLRSVLTSPDGAAAASRVGVNAEALSARLAALSDPELRELAERAALLGVDPVAGGTRKTVFIVVAILVLLALFAMILNPEAFTPPPVPRAVAAQQ